MSDAIFSPSYAAQLVERARDGESTVASVGFLDRGDIGVSMDKTNDYAVEVCAECLRASCWHGTFLCEASRSAGTVTKPASELRTLGLEHPSYFSVKRLTELCGEPPHEWTTERRAEAGRLRS